jgi:hypothetical protein
MKTAICFSGAANRYREFPDTFKQQLMMFKQAGNVELFFAHQSNNNNDEISNIIKNCVYDVFGTLDVIKKIDFVDAYTYQSKFDQSACWSQGNSIESIFSMFSGLRHADLIRQQFENENNFKYNLVIRSRADITFVGNLNFQALAEKFNSDKRVLFTKNWNHLRCWTDTGMLCDQWFAAESDTMSKITNLIDNINDYVDAGCRMHPESLLWWHIKYSNLNNSNWLAPYGFLDFELRMKNDPNTHGWD